MLVGQAIAIEGDGGTRAHLDGEPFGTLPLDIRIAPGSLVVAAA
jgi:diacylglycerol kinase family enzyme